MKFSSILLSSVLFATTIFAAPSGVRRGTTLAQRLAARASRSGNTLQLVDSTITQNLNTTNTEYSTNWAGAVIESPPASATFTAVVATITVPTPSVPSGSSSGGNTEYAASAWVGIDGDTCSTAILQTGVDFYAESNGGTSFDAWYEWYPDYAYDFSGITISAGDVIVMTVTSSTSKKGTAVIENQTTGVTVSKTLTSTSSLCGENAEWIVEDFEENDELVAFADFGTVTFTGCVATDADSSTFGLDDAEVIEIVSTSGRSTTILTDVEIISDTELQVTYE
ncbi:MAG: hypothetical protein M1834_005409 [Cirrosporium novae-zelandiae]|nr:MAG: hypothetical protein M1834_005409 [Cirrosporium novae-zelandiae]